MYFLFVLLCWWSELHSVKLLSWFLESVVVVFLHYLGSMISFCVYFPGASKMHEAIFQILRTENSLELIMASFQLLNELEKVKFIYLFLFV